MWFGFAVCVPARKWAAKQINRRRRRSRSSSSRRAGWKTTALQTTKSLPARNVIAQSLSLCVRWCIGGSGVVLVDALYRADDQPPAPCFADSFVRVRSISTVDWVHEFQQCLLCSARPTLCSFCALGIRHECDCFRNHTAALRLVVPILKFQLVSS